MVQIKPGDKKLQCSWGISICRKTGKIRNVSLLESQEVQIGQRLWKIIYSLLSITICILIIVKHSWLHFGDCLETKASFPNNLFFFLFPV